MADTRLYKVAITPCGKYVHGTEYDALCQVLNASEDGGDGCCYISKKPNKNVRPGTDPTVWALSLERGEEGPQGPSGAGFSNVDIQVNDTSGTPSGTATIADDTLYLSFSGLKGTDGSDGDPGPAGADGKSAYACAVAEGYIGTEQEWLEDLHGTDGIGFGSVSVPSTPDGTFTIHLDNGDNINVNMNHDHPVYPKYALLANEAAYQALTTKESDKLYLIPVSSS